jgi:hypothetical protein
MIKNIANTYFTRLKWLFYQLLDVNSLAFSTVVFAKAGIYFKWNKKLTLFNLCNFRSPLPPWAAKLPIIIGLRAKIFFAGQKMKNQNNIYIVYSWVVFFNLRGGFYKRRHSRFFILSFPRRRESIQPAIPCQKFYHPVLNTGWQWGWVPGFAGMTKKRGSKISKMSSWTCLASPAYTCRI